MSDQPESAFRKFADLFQRIAAWKEALAVSLTVSGFLWKFFPPPALGLIALGVFLFLFFLFKALRQSPPPVTPSLTSQVEDLARMEMPKPVNEPPDERLIILYNSYGLPAYTAIQEILKATYDRCFEQGGWQGLSARYFRDFALKPKESAVTQVQECITNRSSPDELLEAFAKFYDAYQFAITFIWQAMKIDASADWQAIKKWATMNDSFIEQVIILSGGRGRQRLKELLNSSYETRSMPDQILTMLGF